MAVAAAFGGGDRRVENLGQRDHAATSGRLRSGHREGYDDPLYRPLRRSPDHFFGRYAACRGRTTSEVAGPARSQDLGSASRPSPGSAEAGEDFLFVEADHAFLIRAHLRDVDLVEARFDVLADRGYVLFRVGPAGDLLRDHVLGDELAGLLEQGRGRQLLGKLPRDEGVAPGLVRDLHRLLLVLVPADLDAGLSDALAALLAVGLDVLAARRRSDEAVADARRNFERLRAE